MKSSLKIKLLNSSVYPVISKLSNLFGLKQRLKGRDNECTIKSSVLFRKSSIYVDGDNNRIIVGTKCRFRNLLIEIIGHNNEIVLNDYVCVYEKTYISIKGDNCKCIIGPKTTVGSASFFLEESNTNILIGEDCMLGRYISVSTTDFHSILDLHSGKRINNPEDIVLGTHVWVGSYVDIGKGVVVADNSILRSHAVVTKKFNQKNICIAGVPAKIIKENISWSREKL